MNRLMASRRRVWFDVEQHYGGRIAMGICKECKELWHNCRIVPVRYADGRTSCDSFVLDDDEEEPLDDLMDAKPTNPCACCEVVADESCDGCGLDANENEERRVAAERGIL